MEYRRSALDRTDIVEPEQGQGRDGIANPSVPSMFNSLEVKVLYPT